MREYSEIKMIKHSLLLLCNKNEDDYLFDTFLNTIVNEISNLIYDMRHKSTKQYLDDYKEQRIKNFKNCADLGLLKDDYFHKTMETELESPIMPLEAIKDFIEKEERDTNVKSVNFNRRTKDEVQD